MKLASKIVLASKVIMLKCRIPSIKKTNCNAKPVCYVNKLSRFVFALELLSASSCCE